MNLFALTRALIDIDSTTGHEREAGDFLFRYLEDLAGRTGGAVERMARIFDIGADQRRDFGCQLLDAGNAFGLGAELVMKDDLAEFRQPIFQLARQR